MVTVKHANTQKGIIIIIIILKSLPRHIILRWQEEYSPINGLQNQLASRLVSLVIPSV